MMNNIELLEPESTVKEGASVSRNQIKTKPSTFERIKRFFNSWRLSRNNKKLEKKQDEFRNLEFSVSNEGGISKKDKNVIYRKAKKIAEIEKKIKLLNHENVPISFVETRALKIKNKMMSTISATADGMYRIVSEEEKKKFFENETLKAIENPIVQNTEAEKQSEIDVEKTSAINKETITSEIEAAMSGISNEESQSIDEEQLRQMMSKKIEETAKDDESDIQQSIDRNSSETEKIIDREEIERTINAKMFDEPEKVPEQEPISDNTNEGEEKTNDVQEISPSAVAKEVGVTQDIQIDDENNMQENEVVSSESNTKKQESKVELDEYNTVDRISHNEATIAKVQKYSDNENSEDKDLNINEIGNNVDENSNKEPEENTNGIEPLSNQQIKTMIKDLEDNFLKPYEKSLANDTKDDEVIREVPIVAPEREEENKENIKSEDINDKPISNEDVEEARKRIAESQLRIEKAEERQRISKKRWQEKEAIRHKKEEQEKVSVQTVNSLFEKLRERIEAERVYADALEDDCEYNENKAREEEEKERNIDTRIADNEARAEELLALLEVFDNNVEKETKGRSI